MLEMNVQQLVSYSLADKQEYWIHAVEATQQTSTCTVDLSEGATNDGTTLSKTGALSTSQRQLQLQLKGPRVQSQCQKRTKSPQTKNRC